MVAGKGTASEPLNIAFGRTANTTYPWFQGSHYHAFQLKLNRRFSNGFMMNTSYAFGKSIDYSGYNALGFVDLKGLTRYDRRHVLTYSADLRLPFGAGKKMATSGLAKALLGGWQVTWESGLPLNDSGVM